MRTSSRARCGRPCWDWPRRRPGSETSAAALGGAVDLLEVDAEGAEEAEGVGTERRAAGVAPARVAQAKLVAHRTVDEDLAEPVAEPVMAGMGLPSVLSSSRRSASARKYSYTRRFSGEASAARTCRPVSMFSQMRGGARNMCRPQLAQVALHRLRALRAIAGRARHHARAERIRHVADPAHRQIAQPVVAAVDRLDRMEDLGGGDHVGVTQHHALGAARGARRIGDHRDVVGVPLVELALEVAGIRLGEVRTHLLQLREGLEDGFVVSAHAARSRRRRPAAGSAARRQWRESCRPAPGPRPRRSIPRHGPARRRARLRWSPGRAGPTCRPAPGPQAAPSRGGHDCRRVRRACRRA